MSLTDSSAGTRIASLLDGNSFVEIGGSMTARSTDFNVNGKTAPGDGVITGYGLIEGQLVYVYSQDAAVLGGTIGEMHGRKIAGLYSMAMKMGAPVIGLIDCGGVRLEEATDALDALGQIFRDQILASGLIPQITAVFGNCGGGLSVVPALSDFSFMESGARLYTQAPNAIDGNDKAKNDTSAAEFRSANSGIIDFVGSEAEILGQIRALIPMLPDNNAGNNAYTPCTDDLNRACDIAGAVEDPSIIVRTIADDYVFFETKKDYAKDMLTGLIRLNGETVGVVANRSKIYAEDGSVSCEFPSVLSVNGCRKAASFIRFCDAFSIPVLSLTNVTGFASSIAEEKDLADAVASLTYAFTDATVPKVNLVTGKAYGSAYVVMNSKSIGADMVFAWPDAEIGTMDPQMASKIMYYDLSASERAEKAEEYRKLQTNADSAARRGYVDTIIAPEDTRKHMIGAFEMLFTKADNHPEKKHASR